MGTHFTPPCALRAQQTNNRARLLAAAIVSATAALTAPLARAQSWVGPGGGVFSGNFSTATNWSPATVPGATNTATFSLNQNYAVTFTTNITNAGLIFSNTNGTTTFNFSGTNVRTYTLSSSATFNDGFAIFDKLNLNVQGTLLVRTDNVLRFINGADATFNILTIADTGVGSNGTVSVENVNSQLISNNPFSINAIGRAGNSGTLSFSSSAGGSIAGTVVLAADNIAGSKGFLNVLSGATVSVVGVEGGTSGASAQMAALKVQDAGSVLTLGDGGGAGGLIWGANTGPSMTVDVLSGGTLKFNTAGIFTLNPTAVMTVNAATVDTVPTFITVNGALTVTNGAHFSQAIAGLNGIPFNVGNGTSTGAVVHVGGASTLLTVARARIGGAAPALFDQTGGTVTVDNQLQVSNGTYAMAGGSLTTPRIVVGANFNQTGGTIAVPGTGSTLISGMSIGQGGTQTANYNLTGASASLSVAGTILLGDFTSGVFTHSAGNNTTANLVIGNGSTAAGDYILSGKTVLSATNVTVGLSGVGNFHQNGGTHTATTLEFAVDRGSAGNYNMSAGTLNLQTLNMQGQGSGQFTQTGGNVNIAGTLNLNPFSDASATYSIQGGTLTANSANIEAFATTTATTFFQNGGTVNIGSLFIVRPGAFYNFFGGGSLAASFETIRDRASFLQLDGSHVVNNLVIDDSGTYSFTGGTLTASLLQVLRNGRLSISGTRLSGTSMTVAGNLDVGFGGPSTLAIDTTLFPESAANLQDDLNLAAPVTLQGGAILNATIGTPTVAPRVLVQLGVTLAGDGSVTVPVSNNGLIEARSGALALHGASMTNTGTLRNAPGASLFIDATTFTNSGTITVNAGFMTFKAPLISRSLTIAGGALGTPLLTNTNGGSIRGFGQITGNLDNFAAIEFLGPTQIVGNFTNRAGATLTVRNDQTLITGQSVNNGTITTLNGKVIFDGGLLPAAVPGAPLAAAASTGGGIDGAGTTTLNGASTLIASYVRQQSLTLSGTPTTPAVVSLRPKAFGGQTSVLNTLTIPVSGGTMIGRLDLADTALLIDYPAGPGNTPLGFVRSAITSGNHGGDWTGNGITSSSAAANTLTALGYAEAADVLTFTAGAASFQGQSADASSVLVRYTLAGDANLDGAVDFLDLARLAQSYNVTDGARQWPQGDFNYDGNTDFLDLARLAQNYNTALPDAPIPGATPDFQTDLAAAFAAVPEPAALTAILMGGLLLTRPRRRRNAAAADSQRIRSNAQPRSPASVQ